MSTTQAVSSLSKVSINQDQCVHKNYLAYYVEVGMESGVNSDDIVSTLQYYGLLKYWKGKHIILKRKVYAMYCMVY